MTANSDQILVVGASGSIGRHVVAEVARQGYAARALVRDAAQRSLFPESTDIVVGDFTKPETLAEAVDGITGIVFTHGTYGDADGAEQVNYGAVRNVLGALTAPARIALMTTIGVTKPTPGHDWKRRGERLLRASGLPYTIVRPGWFDYNDPDQHRLVMLQGDTRWAGDASDGVISRQQIAEVLVSNLGSAAANRKTLELVAEPGDAQPELTPLFDALRADPADALDAVLDHDNHPLDHEPARVAADLAAMRGRFADR